MPLKALLLILQLTRPSRTSSWKGASLQQAGIVPEDWCLPATPLPFQAGPSLR